MSTARAAGIVLALTLAACGDAGPELELRAPEAPQREALARREAGGRPDADAPRFVLPSLYARYEVVEESGGEGRTYERELHRGDERIVRVDRVSPVDASRADATRADAMRADAMRADATPARGAPTATWIFERNARYPDRARGLRAVPASRVLVEHAETELELVGESARWEALAQLGLGADQLAELTRTPNRVDGFETTFEEWMDGPARVVRVLWSPALGLPLELEERLGPARTRVSRLVELDRAPRRAPEALVEEFAGWERVDRADWLERGGR